MPEQFETTMEYVVALTGKVESMERHIGTMNDEMGEVRDEQRRQSELLTMIRIDMADTKANASWLMRFFWVIAAASIGGFFSGLANLIW